jgi:Skp family chaperone for outer membrane proteins
MCLAMPMLYSQAAAPDSATTQPVRTVRRGAAAARAQRNVRNIRLPKPYSELSQVTDQQKQKIAEIRREIAAQRQELARKEHDQINAVLSDAQRAQLAEIEQKQAQEQQLKVEAQRLEREQQRRNANSKPAQ